MESLNENHFDEMIKISKEFRFTAIDSAILIESMITAILVNYLSNSENKEIIAKHLFSDVLTFEKKIMLFNSLNKKGLLYLGNTDKEISSKLNYIQNLRNLMAHSSLNTQTQEINNFNKKEIRFTSFTQRANREITLEFYSLVDDPSKFIFSRNVMIKNINTVLDYLQLILNQQEKQ